MKADLTIADNGMQACLVGTNNRLHLQHGPIDMIINADGKHRYELFTAAKEAGKSILTTLVDELPLLRTPFCKNRHFKGLVAQRMQAACRLANGRFVTPMIAVAGAVADHILAAMLATELTAELANNITKISVNNGGDVAFWTAPGALINAQIVGVNGGKVKLRGPTIWRGLATSGWRGRSQSLGIADSVTVLARSAANADIAATLLANAVNLPEHEGIARVPANSIYPESDLDDRLVTIDVPTLSQKEVCTALEDGATLAQQMLDQGQIAGAVMSLQGSNRIIGMADEIITHKLVKNDNNETKENHA